MELDFAATAFICILSAVGGFVDSIAGGGGLIGLPAFLLAGVPVHYALGTNKLVSSLGKVMSIYRYHKLGYIDFRLIACCIPFCVAGASLGARCNLALNDTVVTIVLLFAIPISAMMMFVSKTFKNSDHHSRQMSYKKRIMMACLCSLIMGFYDGLIGPGAGTFLIMILVFLSGMSIQQANGNAKVINFSTAISALVIFAMNGYTLWALAFMAGACCIIGNYLGTRFFVKKGLKGARIVMFTILIVFFIKETISLCSS